jgi:NAD(P)-dependent dehydrogenase (short-subunit alcohol dehydrogenase family)
MSTDPSSDDLLDRIRDAAELLESIVDDRSVLAVADQQLRKRLLMAAGRAARPSKDDRRKLARAQRKRDRKQVVEHDTQLLDRTGIRRHRANPIFQTPRRQGTERPPPLGTLHDERTCYVCREKYTEVHHFYDHLCVPCGDLNYAKRDPVADLSGRVALVTGARVKIGYQAAIQLLRNGAQVEVVTRFPRDAARRYAAEPDFAEWGHRLHVHGVDLRHTPSVERLCQQLLQRLDRLDVLINNACQTVRRPAGFYGHLMELELGPVSLLTEAEQSVLGVGARAGDDQALVPMAGEGGSAALSQVPLLPEDLHQGGTLFPAGQLDADLQQVDLRKINSWRLQMAEVSTVELLEVQLVNAVAPYVLNARLKPLMQAVPTNDAHVVNVSAMEGQFYRTFKSDKHPHTNMAKAALNMMTRTAALDYIEHGIHMNSVDTGWVTDEDPAVHAERKRAEHRFHPPLDIVDGAARIVDPFIDGVNTGKHVWGQFLKDYKPTDW